jgi:hypothetical protein
VLQCIASTSIETLELTRVAATHTKGSQATLVFTETMRPNVPPCNASTLERKAYLDQQLESLRETPVLGGLKFLPGLNNRLHGGMPLSLCVPTGTTRVGTYKTHHMQKVTATPSLCSHCSLFGSMYNYCDYLQPSRINYAVTQMLAFFSISLRRHNPPQKNSCLLARMVPLYVHKPHRDPGGISRRQDMPQSKQYVYATHPCGT